MKSGLGSLELTPARLRLILIVALLLALGAQALVTAIGQRFLANSSVSVTEAVTLASSSQETLDSLSRADDHLTEKRATVDRATRILAGENYQAQIIRDITRYAEQTGIHIRGFSFQSGESITDENSTSIPNTATETVTLSLETPVDYATILRFVKLAEGNLLQLNLQSLNLSSGASDTPDGPSNAVNAPTLTFELYRKS